MTTREADHDAPIRDRFVTHALPYGTQGTPRQLDTALCGAVIALQDNAGHLATCPTCRAQLEYLESLEV